MPGESEARSAADARREARSGPGIFSNSLINIVGLVTISSMGAIGGLVTARVLGREGVGILAVTWGFVEFGRAITSCTHVPSILQYHRGRDESLVFGTSLAVKIVLSTFFFAIIIVSAPVLAGMFHVPTVAILLASTVLLVGSFFEVGAARLEAVNRMVRSNTILASGSVVGLTAVLLLALSGGLDVLTSIYTTLLANATMSIGAAVVAYRGLRLRIEAKLGLEMTRYGLRIVAAALLTQGLIWTDTLMVSRILGNEATGVYQVVFQLTYVMVTASTAMAVALVPALSDLVGRGEDTSHGYQRGTLIALTLSSLVAIVYLVFGRLILGLYGPEFDEGYTSLLVLTLFGVAASLAVPAASMLTVHGHATLLTTLSFMQLLLNIPLNWILIHEIGISGAATATTTVFVAGTIVTWWAVRRATGAWPFSRAVFAEGLAYARARLRR